MDFTAFALFILTCITVMLVYVIWHVWQRNFTESRSSFNRMFAENGRRLSEFGLSIERKFSPTQMDERNLGTAIRRRSTLESINDGNENVHKTPTKMTDLKEEDGCSMNLTSERIIDAVVKSAVQECDDTSDVKCPSEVLNDDMSAFKNETLSSGKNIKDNEKEKHLEKTDQNDSGKQSDTVTRRIVGFKCTVNPPEDDFYGQDCNILKKIQPGTDEEYDSVKPLGLFQNNVKSRNSDLRRKSIMPILHDFKHLPRRKSVLPFLNEELVIPSRRNSILPVSSSCRQTRRNSVMVRPPAYTCPRKTSVIFNSDIFAHSPKSKSSIGLEDMPEVNGASGLRSYLPRKSIVANALKSSWSSFKESANFWQRNDRQSSRRTSCTGTYYEHRRRSSCITQSEYPSPQNSILNKIPDLKQIVLSGSEKLKQAIGNACKGDDTGVPYFQKAKNIYGRRQSTHIPKTKGNYLTGNLTEYKSVFGPQAHAVLTSKCLKHGPLYEISALGQRMVFLFDHKDIECLKKSEGKYPKHMDFKHLRIYRQRNNLPLGVLLSNGEEWKKQRRILSKVMVSSVANVHFIPVINQVAKEAVSLIKEKSSTGGIYMPGKDAGNYSIEAFGRVLYGRDLQCLDSDGDTDLHKFVEIAKKNFDDANALMTLPSCLMLLHPAWRRHNERWNFLLETTIKQVKLTLQEGGKIPFCVLASLVKGGEMTEPEMLVNLTDLLLASIDTTSNVIQWCLYELSRQPHLQAKIVDDYRHLSQASDEVTFDVLHNMKLLKAVVKETLRLHPVGFFASRTTIKPMVVRQYTVPQKANVSACMYVMGRDKSFIKNPDTFRPSRWLMGDTQLDYFYKDVPFGFGPRMCIGRRVAEMEIALFILHFCLAFEFKLNPTCHVEHELKLLLVPSRHVELIMSHREFNN